MALQCIFAVRTLNTFCWRDFFAFFFPAHLLVPQACYAYARCTCTHPHGLALTTQELGLCFLLSRAFEGISPFASLRFALAHCSTDESTSRLIYGAALDRIIELGSSSNKVLLMFAVWLCLNLTSVGTFPAARVCVTRTCANDFSLRFRIAS